MFYGATPAIFEKARILRENMTEAEQHLWKYLSHKKLEGLKFRRQHPMAGFIADFYCHSERLVIELDGGIHDELEQEVYDKGRQSEIEAMGVRVLRFKNQEVFDDVQSVLEKIKNFIKSEKISN